MAQTSYKMLGFRGLSGTGKFLFISILVIVEVVVWILWGRYKYAEASGVAGQTIAMVVPVIAGVLLAYLASFTLPKRRFTKREFFCASCGEYIGTRIVSCPNCGCNKYMTDETRAEFLRKKRT